MITVFDYDAEKLEQKELKNLKDCAVYEAKPSITWIDIDGIGDTAAVRKICECFNIHPLVQDDILHTTQRPKIEYFEGYIYIVLKMLSLDEKKSKIKAEQVSLVLGKNFVLSFQEKPEGDVFNPIRERLKIADNRIRKMGADYLVYSLIDVVIDNYFTIMEKLGERVEFLEEELVKDPTPKTMQTIHKLKQEMIYLRRSVWPLREVISAFEREESDLVNPATKVYVRDIYDHTIQVIDIIETFRDIVSGMVDIYLSSINNKLNEVVKVLTIITTIFMPLSFIAGVYGMNFHFLPELSWRFGYPFALGIMLAVAFVMVIFFRRKKWL